MPTLMFIIALFCRVDDALRDVPTDPLAHLHPSELVTVGILYGLKGGSGRAFYHWRERDYRPLFPRLPERTRRFRLLTQYRELTDRLLADPTLLGVVDTYGIELVHPYREGRSSAQLGRKGLSNHRWIVGAKLFVVLNRLGLVVSWAADSADVHDTTFAPLIAEWADQMVVFGDHGFHAAQGDPANLHICPKGQWGGRMVVETVFSLLTRVSRTKQMGHRSWDALAARLAYLLAAFNLLAQWYGLPADEQGFVRLSIAEFGL
jgi:hypothetical protein